MKRLSDFKFEEKGIDIAAQLLTPISRLSADKDFKELKAKGGFTVEDIAKVLAKNEKEALCEVFAILSEKTVEEYKQTATAATFLIDMYSMFADEDIMLLFGIQLRKSDAPSSGAVTENTRAKKK